jgi:hypothetical protein
MRFKALENLFPHLGRRPEWEDLLRVYTAAPEDNSIADAGIARIPAAEGGHSGCG